MKIFQIGFLPVTLIDFLDIIAVTIVFYQVYRIMSGTRATQMFAGLLIILIAGSLAQMIGMSGLTWLIQSVGAVWVIAFVILFQPELRRMLIRIGQLGFLKTIFRDSGEKVVNEVTKTAIELSKKRFGGLFVIQRTTGLRGVLETGVSLQAEVSSDLMISIFYPRSPLHDGAILISGETVLAAKCLLPLSLNPKIDPSLGTRHRAGLGITEETDAIAVVVSEETGNITIAEHGKFISVALDEEHLKAALAQLLFPRRHSSKSSEPLEEDKLLTESGDGVSN